MLAKMDKTEGRICTRYCYAVHVHVFFLFSSDTVRPVEEAYNPVPDGVPLPSVSEYFDTIKRPEPNACAMDAVEIHKRKKRRSSSHLNIKSPVEKASEFFTNHLHDCTDECKRDVLLRI